MTEMLWSQLIRYTLAIVVVVAIVTLCWHGTVTGGEAIAALGALVGGLLHSAGTAAGAAQAKNDNA